MKKNQFLLLKLAEECVEVAHRASKQLQFGKNEIQKDQQKTNSVRLKEEILDLLAVFKLLIDAGEVDYLDMEELPNTIESKREKLQKYLNLSASLGQLPRIKL